ncbi:hypothetical protein B0H16DRAFT_1328140, partial [Mycena metata]
LCDFAEIIKFCLQFTVTHNGIYALRLKINDWVHRYEEYYYQYDEARLRVCTLTVHGFVHVPDDLYDLEDELSSVTHAGKTKPGTVFAEYPESILKVPYKRNYIPDNQVRTQIGRYFSQLLGCRPRDILVLLPEVMPSFGKVRIRDGDSFRSASAAGDGSSPERDMSFIRLRSYFFLQTQTVTDGSQIFYGRLERILVCDLPDDQKFGKIAGKKRLLAVITPCKNTGGKDAALEITSHNGFTSLLVTDLQSTESLR